MHRLRTKRFCGSVLGLALLWAAIQYGLQPRLTMRLDTTWRGIWLDTRYGMLSGISGTLPNGGNMHYVGCWLGRNQDGAPCTLAIGRWAGQWNIQYVSPFSKQVCFLQSTEK